MGVSKVVLVDPNTQTPEVLMDVTGDDTSASVLLAGNVGTRNDGEKVTGNIQSKSSSDLTASGATVTAPAGYYASAASKSVTSGTAGTPTATKSSVSNHSVSVTPSVTNTTGYITGSTKTGTSVSVSASELVSGTKSITDNGTNIDVTNYAAVDVAVPSSGGSPVAGLTNALELRSASSFTIQVSNGGYHFYWDGTIEWTDGVQPWATWDGLTTLTASDGVLYLRGTNNTQISGNNAYGGFKLTGTNISCNGNIETLLDYATVARGEHPTMADYCYYNLFGGCTALVSAPALPATELTEYCYWCMFYGCTSLISAPALPATTAMHQCYDSMFYGCTSLTSAPTISATTLEQYCFNSMFNGCTALTSAPALPATTLASACYQSMFAGCTALTSAPALPAMTLATNCYKSMFYGCTNLVSAPALPATTLSGSCYSQMFYNCTSLASAPDLPATTTTYGGYYTASQCYQYMFYNCTALTSPPVIALTKLSNYCFQYMFAFCTSLNSMPALPVATLTNYCYNNMFRGCTSLKVSATYDATNYPYTLRIPKTGTGSAGTSSLDDMFTGTGGSFTGTPSINTDYYTENPLVE